MCEWKKKARNASETYEAEHPSTPEHHSSGKSNRFVQQPITSLSWQQTVAPLDESLTCISWLRQCRAPKLPLALAKGEAGGNGEATSDHRSTKATGDGDVGRTCGTIGHKDQKTCDLDCKRPPYSYAQLISMALRSCSSHRLTIPEIYHWIQKKFPYFRSNANRRWRNSVRHTLSLLPMFTKERVPGEKLSFWSVRDEPAETQARLSATTTERLFNPTNQDSPMNTVNAIASPSHILVPVLSPIIVSSPSPVVTKTAQTRPRLLAPKFDNSRPGSRNGSNQPHPVLPRPGQCCTRAQTSVCWRMTRRQRKHDLRRTNGQRTSGVHTRHEHDTGRSDCKLSSMSARSTFMVNRSQNPMLPQSNPFPPQSPISSLPTGSSSLCSRSPRSPLQTFSNVQTNITESGRNSSWTALTTPGLAATSDFPPLTGNVAKVSSLTCSSDLPLLGTNMLAEAPLRGSLNPTNRVANLHRLCFPPTHQLLSAPQFGSPQIDLQQLTTLADDNVPNPDPEKSRSSPIGPNHEGFDQMLNELGLDGELDMELMNFVLYDTVFPSEREHLQ
uniref:hepatocyte nuclear factor 3-alpha-like isoform X2 n=1 Tax=Myxine glutinosa TaxID=7769 RepID=UPI00358F88BB